MDDHYSDYSPSYDSNLTIHETIVIRNSLFQIITSGILLTSVAILGIVGNIISIAVLSRPRMRSSINCCLIALATFDTLVLVTSVLMCGLQALPESSLHRYHRHIYPEIMLLVYPVGLIAQTGSVWITVTVTGERYIAVCKPLRAKFLCTYGRARLYIVVITVLSVVYNLPRFWEVRREYIFNVETNETEIIPVPSDLRKNEVFVKVYLIWLYLFVMYFVPFLILTILNGLIWRQVQEANKERRRLSRLQRKEISLALMLFCVVIVFVFCNMLALVVSVLEAFDIIVDDLTHVSNLLVTVNSSVNFVIYCIFGQKFRRILVRIFICGCRKKSDEQMEESVYPMPSMNTTMEVKHLSFSNNGTSFYSTRSHT